MSESTLVLGGGLAGLSCAYDLARRGHRVTVLERERDVGGLATSFSTDGYTYDLGPHRFYTQSRVVLDQLEQLFEPDELLRPVRKSQIYMRGRFFDYPLAVGNVVRNLPPWVLARCFADYGWERLRGLVAPSPDDNFESWTRSRFGKTLYEIFFGEYTAKAWGIPCDQISADWASQRISLLNLGDAVRQTLRLSWSKLVARLRSRRVGQGDGPRTYVMRFYYPRHGGIGEIARRYRRGIEALGGQVICGASVERLGRDGERVTDVTFAAGGVRERLEMDSVVSTIPLTVLARLMEPELPVDVGGAAGALWHKSIVFSYLVVRRPSLTDCHWIYLPERHLRAHRISEFKNFSPHAAPPDRTILAVEITTDPGSDVWKMDADEAGRLAARDLETIGFLEAGEVERTYLKRVRFAYPMYDLVYRRNLERLLEELDGFCNLITTGRQGLFKYNNMDGSIEMGLAAAAEVDSGMEVDHRAIAAGQEYLG